MQRMPLPAANDNDDRQKTYDASYRLIRKAVDYMVIVKGYEAVKSVLKSELNRLQREQVDAEAD